MRGTVAPKVAIWRGKPTRQARWGDDCVEIVYQGETVSSARWASLFTCDGEGRLGLAWDESPLPVEAPLYSCESEWHLTQGNLSQKQRVLKLALKYAQ